MTNKNITLSALFLLVVLSQFVLVSSAQQCQPPTFPPSQRPNIFNDEQESDLGDAIAEQLQHNFRVIDDDSVTADLNRIGQRIIKNLPPNKLRFQFFLVDLPEANAFMLPGGRVYVSRKLIGFTQSEDELAAVMSHEIGHLVARQSAQDMTYLLKEVLNITSVGDRKDIFDKYNKLMDNAARNQRAFKRVDSESEADQLVADQIGLYALLAAGYDPQAFVKFWDRFAELKGKTGSFFSDLFGTTSPNAKRLREMVRNVSSLPPSCLGSRSSAPTDQYDAWKSAVVNYTGLGRKESIHGLVSKTALIPSLQSEMHNARFSPDGKYILAQDDSGINILTREPFAPLFRIDALDSKDAQFSPDSKSVVFYDSTLRVQIWDIGEQKVKTTHDMVVRKNCFQTMLSPDGKELACLDSDMNLLLFDVASGNQVFQKKSFYMPNPIDIIVMELNKILNYGDSADLTIDWVNMGFSPDGRYFVAGQRGTNAFMTASFDSALAVDLQNMSNVQLKGQIKKLVAGGFAFVGPDKLVGYNRDDPNKSGVASFPAGDIVAEFPLSDSKLSSPTHGNYVLLRPFRGYAVAAMNLETKKLFIGAKTTAFDIYDDVYIAEQLNGDLAMAAIGKSEAIGKVRMSTSTLGRLYATSLSTDFRWLAVSGRTRGAVWDLSKGQRLQHVRGFRGAYVTDEGVFYADFPEFGGKGRSMARIDLTGRAEADSRPIEERGAQQFGPCLISSRPSKKGGSYRKDVVMEMRDTKTQELVWSKPYPKEAPEFWVNAREGTLVMVWPASTDAARGEIKNDPKLVQQLAATKEKEGNYFVQVLDSHTGKTIGQLIIETGKGSFSISSVFAFNDWLVISDSQNRVLIYTLSTGEQKGKVFGARAAASAASGLVCVENEEGKLAIYDLASAEKRDQFIFSSPISMMRFSPDGKKLFVLAASQTAYVLDVSSLTR